MRTSPAVLAIIVLAATAASARADDVTGMYDVKYEDVSTNCPSPLRYANGKLEIRVKGKELQVDIDRTPLMIGSPSRAGKISARSKSGPTMLDGMNGTFSIAGKVAPEGTLSFVMVGEYTANGKSLCTQSWNVTGGRAEAKPAVKKKALLDDADAARWPFVVMPSGLTR